MYYILCNGFVYAYKTYGMITDGDANDYYADISSRDHL